jgi:hypothetical protein
LEELIIFISTEEMSQAVVEESGWWEREKTGEVL